MVNTRCECWPVYCFLAIIVWVIYHPSQNPRASTTEEEERGEEGTLTLIRFRSVRGKPYIRRIQEPSPVALRERDLDVRTPTATVGGFLVA